MNIGMARSPSFTGRAGSRATRPRARSPMTTQKRGGEAENPPRKSAPRRACGRRGQAALDHSAHRNSRNRSGHLMCYLNRTSLKAIDSVLERRSIPGRPRATSCSPQTRGRPSPRKPLKESRLSPYPDHWRAIAGCPWRIPSRRPQGFVKCGVIALYCRGMMVQGAAGLQETACEEML